MSRNGSDYKSWELLLLVFGILLLGGAATLYFSDISLQSYLPWWQDPAERSKEKVGTLALTNGGVLRQLNEETEFRSVQQDALLYNYDTLVTGPDGSATVLLNEGNSIELGPSTMVRLTFEKRLSLEGISRAASIEVVTGNVTGQAKVGNIVLRTRDRVIAITKNKQETVHVAAAPLKKATPVPRVSSVPKPTPTPSWTPTPVVIPKPSPTPSLSPSPTPPPQPSPTPEPLNVQIHLLSPKPGERFTVDRGSQVAEKLVNLEWAVIPSTTRVRLILRDRKRDELINKTFELKTERGAASVKIEAPGVYEWEMMCVDCEAPARSRVRTQFVVNPEFEAIEMLPPLVGGQQTLSNAYSEKQAENFEITVRWKPYPRAKKYRIHFLDSPTSRKTLMERETEDEQYVFNKDKVYAGRVYYGVRAPLSSGFVVTSSLTPFRFDFLPPVLVIPEDKALVSRDVMASNNNSLLMTWQKTSFTERYQIELAKDPMFKTLVVSKSVKENFYLMSMTEVGKYWWRVRSVSKGVASAYGKPHELNILP